MKIPKEYESPMHFIAEALMSQFKQSSAINYLEQSFESKTNDQESFVLTMQIKNGLTPCEKLAIAEKTIAELESKLLKVD